MLLLLGLPTKKKKKKIGALSSGSSQFEKLEIQVEKHLKFILSIEKKGSKKSLNHCMKICPSGSKPGFPYRIATMILPIGTAV